MSANKKYQSRLQCHLTAWLVALLIAAVPALAAEPASANLDKLSILENHYFSRQYANDPEEKRLQRLEQFIFGGSQIGDFDGRVSHLSKMFDEIPKKVAKPPSSAELHHFDSDREEELEAMLPALGEPLYTTTNAPVFMIRFIFLRTFRNPETVTLLQQNNEIRLEFRQLDMKAGYRSNKFVVNQKQDCKQDDLVQAKAVLASTRFWDVSSDMPTVNIDDATRCYVEVWDHGRHRVIGRWNTGDMDQLAYFSLT